MQNQNINFLNFLGSDFTNIGIRCHGELNVQTNEVRLVLDNLDEDAPKAHAYVMHVMKCKDDTSKALCNHFNNTHAMRTS